MEVLDKITDNLIKEQVEYAIAENLNLKIFSKDGIVYIKNGEVIDYLSPIDDPLKGILYVIRIKQNNVEENYFKINSLGLAIDYANRIKNIDENSNVDILMLKSEYNQTLNDWIITEFKYHSSIIM